MSLGDLLLPSLFRLHRPRLRLGTSASQPFERIPLPNTLSFRIEAREKQRPPAVHDTVEAGDVIGFLGEAPVIVPVRGRVTNVRALPYLHGGVPALLVSIQRDEQAPKAVSLEAPREELLKRLDQAGVCSYGRNPVLLSKLLGDDEHGWSPATVIVSAADQEPLLMSEAQLLVERAKDVPRALQTVSQAAGGAKVQLALLKTLGRRDLNVDVTTLELEDNYPDTLPEMVARQAQKRGARQPIVVISLETALAADRAITQGELQLERHLTVIGANETRKNVIVTTGTPAAHVLSHIGFAVEKGDIVALGGPMRGRSEYLMDVSVDVATEALMVIPEGVGEPVANDPCVSCGACIEVCPVSLQPNMLSRNSEFSLHERNRDLQIHVCIQCGLCDYVCQSGRPLLQWIELSLNELDAAERDLDESEAS